MNDVPVRSVPPRLVFGWDGVQTVLFPLPTRSGGGGRRRNGGMSSLVVDDYGAMLGSAVKLNFKDGVEVELTDASANISVGQPSKVAYFDDFLATSTAGELNWTIGSNGAGSGGFINVPETGHPGILRLSTGTTSGGRGMARQQATGMYDSAERSYFEAVVNVVVLEDGTNNFFVNVGWTDNTSGGQGTTAIAFRLDGTNWFAYARKTGSDTVAVDTGIAGAANTWVTLRIETDSTGATFFINGAQVATIASANLPAGAGQPFSPIAIIQKQAGTTNRNLLVDCIGFGYTTTR